MLKSLVTSALLVQSAFAAAIVPTAYKNVGYYGGWYVARESESHSPSLTTFSHAAT